MPVVSLDELAHVSEPIWAKWLNTMTPMSNLAPAHAPNHVHEDLDYQSGDEEEDKSQPVDPAAGMWTKVSKCLSELKKKYLTVIFNIFSNGLPTGDYLKMHVNITHQAIVS
jgi:hypothetical protein